MYTPTQVLSSNKKCSVLMMHDVNLARNRLRLMLTIICALALYPAIPRPHIGGWGVSGKLGQELVSACNTISDKEVNSCRLR